MIKRNRNIITALGLTGNTIKSEALAGVLALTAGLMVTLLLIGMVSGTPLVALADFFTGVWSSSFYIGNLLNTASLFMWAALGACLALASGSLNLGGEGQIYVSGFVAALVLFYGGECGLPAFVTVGFAGIAAVSAGVLSVAVPVVLYRYRRSTELLTTFLVSAITIPLIDAAISGPLRDTTKNLLAIPAFAENLRLPRLLPPSSFNISFFLALIVCVGVAFALYTTKKGADFCLSGKAPDFARYAGCNVEKIRGIGLLLSGAFHGLAGFFAVWGTYYTCHSGFYSGMGWTALSVALIAKTNPIGVIPAALLLSWIFTAVDRSAIMYSFSFDIESIIQGTILFFISAQYIINKRKDR